MSDERIKRPHLERDHPLRGFAGVFDRRAPPKPAGDPLSGGVALGYSVIDEYLKQGQAVARALSNSAPLGAPPSFGPEAAQDAAQRMMRFASDLASAWLDFVQLSARTTPPAHQGEVPGFDMSPRNTKPSAPPAAAPEPSASRVDLTLAIRSQKPTETRVELKPGAWTSALAVHELRAVDARLPRIAGATLALSDDRQSACVSVDVPDDQPDGSYAGLIVDAESNVPLGSLRIRVGVAGA